MWCCVCVQTAATEEKTILEEAQRSAANERKVKCEDWIPTYFAQVSLGNTVLFLCLCFCPSIYYILFFCPSIYCILFSLSVSSLVISIITIYKLKCEKFLEIYTLQSLVYKQHDI